MNAVGESQAATQCLGAVCPGLCGDAPESRPPSDGVLQQAIAPWIGAARRQHVVKVGLAALDLLVLAMCFLLGRSATWLKDDITVWQAFTAWWTTSGEIRATLFVAVSLLMVVWMGAVNGHYTGARRKPWWDEVRQILLVVIFGAMLDAMVVYLGKWQFSRLWTGATWTLVFFLLPLARLVVKRKLLRAGWLAQPYVLIGSPAQAREAAAALASEPLMGYVPVAVVSPCGIVENPALALGAQQFQPIPLSPEIVGYLREPGPYQIVIALDEGNGILLRNLAQTLMLSRDDVILIPPLSGLPLLGMELSHFFSHDVLLLRARNNLKRRAPQFVKRTVDLLAATLLSLLLAPLLIAVAILIKRENSGPVFFMQPRIGRNGTTFPFIKFRSMVTDADAALERWKQSHPHLWEKYRASNFKLADDPRVTRVGRWIRRTSIDELPQLWNVLRGDMSLVGPRPLLARELPDYGESITIYNAARPGLTGLWQISGRSSTTFEQRIAMDRWYVRNWSLWYDFVILVRTVRVVLKGEGAH